MPMPKPKPGDKEQDFVSRFMANPEMIKDYPDEKQRAAIAYQTFRGKSKMNQQLFEMSKSQKKRIDSLNNKSLLQKELSKKILKASKATLRVAKLLGFGNMASDKETQSIDGLAVGMKEEEEHKDLYEYIQKNGLPDFQTFTKMIATTHLKENPNYYTEKK
jgi:hypothetical protein